MQERREGWRSCLRVGQEVSLSCLLPVLVWSFLPCPWGETGRNEKRATFDAGRVGVACQEGGGSAAT